MSRPGSSGSTELQDSWHSAQSDFNQPSPFRRSKSRTSRARFGINATKYNRAACKLAVVNLVLGGIPNHPTLVLAIKNYEKKYPLDEPWREIDKHGRVWNTYNEEAESFDRDMLEESGDILDILLIFVSS
jgi:hypothetical protein